MKNKSHVLLRIIVIAAMLVLVVAAAIECANGKSLSETAWSLLPPVIAIVLALISKEGPTARCLLALSSARCLQQTLPPSPRWTRLSTTASSPQLPTTRAFSSSLSCWASSSRW